MEKIDVFLEVFKDIRFPFFAADLDRLRSGLERFHPAEDAWSQFVMEIDAPPEKRAALISSLRGLLDQIDMPDFMTKIFANAPSIQQSGNSNKLVQMASRMGPYMIAEKGDQLVWHEESLWPLAYSTFLQHILDVIRLYKSAGEERIKTFSEALTARGADPSSGFFKLVSEYPRHMPTALHYALAALGIWLGGASQFQYFSYYASIRQMYHPPLNLQYAARVGFDPTEGQQLTDGGLIVLPARLVLPLLEAQGDRTVFGSIPFDEVNAANLPNKSFFESMDLEHQRALPGFMLDKYYRTPFRARRPDDFGIYGAQNVLRDHYQEFYDSITPDALIRCKHYCAPVITVSSIEELREYTSRIPVRHHEGLFFRGQRSLYLLKRAPAVKRMLFADSCSDEPSVVTSASRELNYNYDSLHFALKYFMEQKLLLRDSPDRESLLVEWRERLLSPDCRLDYAIIALAQHYGLPSHGLDITISDDVAIWFATHAFRKDGDTSIASYKKLRPDDWPEDPKEWPVVFACQTVTDSIKPSLHDCHHLDAIGFDAKRPTAQKARFFLGGHSDHQNRLAEAILCAFRLAPGHYETESTFASLFPAPSEDPAYQLMLEFSEWAKNLAPKWAGYINRFHP